VILHSSKMEDHLTSNFGGRVRTRACGILVNEKGILLVKHIGIGELNLLWAPPGGEVKFGESISECLIREFQEETGLKIKIESFVTINEFIQAPFHAIELFFLVKELEGNLIKGSDPELKNDEQIIDDVRFVTFKELEIMPNEVKHELLKKVKSMDDLLSIKTSMIKFQ